MEEENLDKLEQDVTSEIQSPEDKITDFEDESVDLSMWKPKQDEDSDDSFIDETESDKLTNSFPPSEVVISTLDVSQDRKVIGLTFLGRSHHDRGSVCQDYHIFKDLGNGWQIYIVSDGAGSASQAHRGAKMNCELGLHLISRLIDKSDWIYKEKLPTDVGWAIEFNNLCNAVRQLTIEKIESLDEPVKPKDFNATFMLMIVTPDGMLCGHIGDGRMGYMDFNGKWHSIITPHKGDEPNQTVFMMNEWDRIRIPKLKMSDVYVPEAIVVRDKPKAVALITDGCENSSWNCTQFDSDIERYVDVNTPFEPFWNTFIEMFKDDTSYNSMVDYVDNSSKPCVLEEDDRTLILGVYDSPLNTKDDETAIHSV